MTSLRVPHYLTRDRQGFWFRIFVPVHLHPIIGRKVFKKSLRTLDAAIAANRARNLAARYAWAFRTVEAGRMSGDEDALKSALAALYGGTAKKLEIEGHTPAGLPFRIKTDGSAGENATAEKMVASMFESEAYRRAVAVINAPPPEPEKPATTGPLLEAAFASYFQTGGVLGAENRDARQRAARRFAAYAGAGARTTDITKAMAVRWLDELQLDRTDIVGTDRRGKPVAKTIPGMSRLTARGYCGHLKGIWDWLIPRGEAESNPWDGIIKIKKVEKKQRRKDGHNREPFDHDQLRTLFDPANLRKATTEHVRWGAVLCLYTGARVGEIAQIYLRDFVQVDGIACLKITDENEGQRTKTDAGQRTIPIHPDLIRLGLMERVEALRAAGKERLFDIKLDGAAGVGAAISQGFSHLVREKLRLQPKRKNAVLGTHSFRKSLTQWLLGKERIASPGKRWQFMGRETGAGINETESEHYGRAFTVQELCDVNEAIEWGALLGLDFDGLRAVLLEPGRKRKPVAERSAYAERRAKERAAEARAAKAGLAGKKK